MKNNMIILMTICLMLTGCNDPKFLDTIPVNEPDLSKIENGDYKGFYTLKLPSGYFIGQPSAEVKVTIKDNKITSIELYGVIKNSMKPVADEIIKGKKINFDAVTSGTFTKKPYKKLLKML